MFFPQERFRIPVIDPALLVAARPAWLARAGASLSLPRMRVLVIIPTYNERDNLPVLVRQVLAHDGYRVMVVDDQSPDGTGEVADALAREFPGRVEVLHRTGKRGLGRSYVEALGLAAKGDADLVCQMDADLSHDPQYLPAMVDAARGRAPTW